MRNWFTRHRAHRDKQVVDAAWHVQLAVGFAATGLATGNLLETWDENRGDLDQLDHAINEATPTLVAVDEPVLMPACRGARLARAGRVAEAIAALREADIVLAEVTGATLAERYGGHGIPVLPGIVS